MAARFLRAAPKYSRALTGAQSQVVYARSARFSKVRLALFGICVYLPERLRTGFTDGAILDSRHGLG
jgi:hypothetical protein